MHAGNGVRERGATRKGQLSLSIGTVKQWKFELRRNRTLPSEPKRLNREAKCQGCTWTRCMISERFTRSCFYLNRKAVSIPPRLAAFGVQCRKDFRSRPRLHIVTNWGATTPLDSLS